MNVKGRPPNWGQGKSYLKVKRLPDEYINALYVKVEEIRNSRKIPKEPAIVKFNKEVEK